MTHKTNEPPNEKQKVMLGLFSRPERWWKARELQEEFSLTKSTVRDALSEFKNELEIVDHDQPKYRIIPGKEYEAWVYIQLGRDGFKTELRDNVDELLGLPSDVRDQQSGLEGF